ncbi:MAG TPA: phage holin family protein [Crocinitomicaceae bacterium]|nr:phage holin family protein [Crocinitomicaceae bacterium]
MSNEKQATFRQITEDLTTNVQTFVKSNIKAVQLEIYERTTNIIASGINLAIIAILALLILFFVNFGVAQLIGEQLGKPSLGYLIVAGFYVLILIIYLIFIKFKKKNVQNAILKNISKTHQSIAELDEEQAQMKVEIEQSLIYIQENVADLKLKIYGEEVDDADSEPTSVLPKPLLITGFSFIFRRFIFKKDSFLRNKMSPLIVELLVTSLIYSEGKLKNLVESVSNFFNFNKNEENE